MPAVQRARCRLGPRRPHLQGGRGRRRVDRQRPEGLDLAAATPPTSACCSPAPTPTRPKHRASPGSRSTCTSPASSVRPAARDDRPRHVQRGLPRPTPACRPAPSSARGTTAGPSPTRRSPTSAPASAPAAAAAAWPWSRPAPSPGAARQSASATSRRTPKAGRRGEAGEEAAKKSDQSTAAILIGYAKGNGTSTDPTIRQDLVRLHILGEIGRFNGERLKATRAAGGDIPGMANIAKLSMSDIVRLQRDLGLRIVGAPGHAPRLHAEQQRGPRQGDGQPVPRA